VMENNMFLMRLFLLSFFFCFQFSERSLVASRSPIGAQQEIEQEESQSIGAKLLIQSETAATGETEEIIEISENLESSFQILNTPILEVGVRDEQNVKWKERLRKFGALVIGAGVANGMIPVYLQNLEGCGISSQSLLKLGMVYAGVTFGLESFAFAFQKSQSSFKWYWHCVAAFGSIAPVLLLFDVENQHHFAAGNQGWDEYYTFFALTAPFLYVNQYFAIHSLLSSFLKTERQNEIEYAVDRLSSDQLKSLYNDVFTEKKKILNLPMTDMPAHSVLPRQKRMYVIGASSIALTSWPFFYGLWKGLSPMQENDVLLSMAACVSFVFEGFLIHSYLEKFSVRDCFMAFPQGVFKTLPIIAITLKTVQKKNWYISYPALVVFPIYCSLRGGNITLSAFEIILQSLPCMGSKEFFQKRKLKELLV